MRAILAVFVLATATIAHADDAKWTTFTGKVVLDAATPIPVMKELIPQKDKEACLAKGKYFDELMIVDPKTRALANVFVWIEPFENARGEPFPKNLIHKDYAEPPAGAVEIDQPCCKFEPHALAARVGQKFVIKNSAPVAHNANWSSENNGNFNPLIPSKNEHVIAKLVAEKNPITITCNIHPEMKAWVRIYDHPYFAVTNAKGEFTIKLAPEGKFRLYVWHEKSGWSGGKDGNKGTPVTLKGETMDMKEIKYKLVESK